MPHKIMQFDPEPHWGSPVRVYRNLLNHRISVQAKIDKRWKVVGHVTELAIANVSFTIRESGRKRVLRDKRKNVHAWAEGILIGDRNIPRKIPIDIPLLYNPYTMDKFLDKRSHRIIETADYLVVRSNEVFCSQDAIKNSPVFEFEGDRPSLGQLLQFSLPALALAA